MNDELNNQLNAALRKFNWALFLGLCIVAISIFFAGRTIAGQMPQSLHGNFSGHLSGGNAHIDDSSREFLSKWQAANFMGMSTDEFAGILASGELRGTYTVFQVERQVWQPASPVAQAQGNTTEIVTPTAIEYEIITTDHYLFSRERLSEWLLGRME